MTSKLFLQALIKFAAGLIIVSLLVFLPAGTLNFPNGLLFIGVLFIPMFFAGIFMMLRTPALLEKRLNAKETRSEQKTVILLSGVMFVAAFVAAGLNFRFRWIVLPFWTALAASAVFLAAYVMFAEVMRENAYLSRTIEVSEGQKVVDTGLYGIVRHPMYSSTLFLFLSMGFVLGSVISFAILLFYIPIISRRIKDEERALEEGLPGYKEYKSKVKYKVIPFIW